MYASKHTGTHLGVSLFLFHSQVPSGFHQRGLTPSPQALLRLVEATAEDDLALRLSFCKQAQDFLQDIEGSIQITICLKPTLLTNKQAVGKGDVGPAPAAIGTQLARGKEAIHLEHRSPSDWHLLL